MDSRQAIIASILLLVVNLIISSHALPLSVDKRWIKDEVTEQRVKLACVNWPGHLETMVPEGLHKRPLPDIVSTIKTMGFNCVRLTYANNMFTRYGEVTVMKSLENLVLADAISGFNQYNPHFLHLGLEDAFRAVVDELGKQGVMVILDNHVSEPRWCCRDNDNNGFWGDMFFDPKEWLKCLSRVAMLYKDAPAVVGMSLRNELRGPNQNWTVWFDYVQEALDLINDNNPNPLIVVSGLNYDTDLTYIVNQSLNMNVQNKVVYEVHRFSFSSPDIGQNMWFNQSLNDACAQMTKDIDEKVAFLLWHTKVPGPIFFSEFGIDQTGSNLGDNNFLPCVMTYLASNDLDWALWALQGSYYYRDGANDPEEPYGILNANWTDVKNPEFHSKLRFLQQKIQDPYKNNSEHLIMYHPLSGKCARVNNYEVDMGDCFNTTKWYYHGVGLPLGIVGTPLCLKLEGEGLAVAVTNNCKANKITWAFSTKSHNQIAIRDENGVNLCLDWDPSFSQKVITRKCICATNNFTTNSPNPQSQWFKLIYSNIS